MLRKVNSHERLLKLEFNSSVSVSVQALHTEIKGKKEKVEDVQKTADGCASSIKVF